VDEKPLGFALDAIVWPALTLGVVAIGVSQFPIGGYRYFPYLLACSEFRRGSKYMCVTLVTLVTLVTRDFRDALSFPVIPGSNFTLLTLFFDPLRICLRQRVENLFVTDAGRS